jgi:type IV pilus assembly protein PilX
MKPLHLPARERGVVLLFGLIALAIMMIGAVAIVRSMNTSLFNAGNLGFKRDLTNQGERAVVQVLAQMDGGVLGTEASRQVNSTASNYRATIFQPAELNAQGLPLALLDNAVFAAVGTAANDIAVADMGVTVRYVVDRLCQNLGPSDPAQCNTAESAATQARSGTELLNAEDASAAGAGAVPAQIVYRLSVRVDGPRETQAFFQTTFTP